VQPPAVPLVLPPFLPGAATLALGAPPSPGEVLTLACAVEPAGGLSVALAPDVAPLLPPCAAAAAASSLCVNIFSSSGVSELRLLLLPPSAASVAPAPQPPPLLTCELRSAAAPAVDSLVPAPLPRFGSSSLLAVPVAVGATGAPPLVAAVLLERWGAPGEFLVLAGGDGAAVSTGGLPRPAAGAWANLSFPADGLAVGALLALLAPLRSSPAAANGSAVAAAPPPMATLSMPSHLLLLAAPGSSFAGAALEVQLGGAPCALNWVTPGGELASVTTPRTAAACGDASRHGMCGVAPLQLSTVGFGAALAGALAPAAAAAAAAAARNETAPERPLALPFSWPPLEPRGAWGAGGAAAATRAVGPLLGVPPAAALAAMGSGGIRLALPCADPTLLPLEACASATAPLPPGGGRCPWGGGAACAACPDGALCPGGALLLALPGFWAASTDDEPSSLLRCAPPDAALRCPGTPGLGGAFNGSGFGGAAAPGWAAAAARGGGPSPCGAGFWGPACGLCAPRYYVASGTCAACPPPGAVLAELLPVLRFAAGLAALGALLLGLAYSARRFGGARAGAASVPRAAQDVSGFLAWAWVATQVLASQFSLLEDSGALPPRLLPLFSAVASLQFKGVSIPPACVETAPFLTFYAAAAVFGVMLSAVVALACGCGGGGGLSCAGGAALRAAALALRVGFGAFSGAAAGALACLPPTPLPLKDYAATAGDGRAARAVLGAGAPPWAALVAAAANPAAAAAANLTAVLRTPIPVSLLAGNPFQPCREGGHEVAWFVAAALTAALAALPLAGLAALRCGATAPPPVADAQARGAAGWRGAAALFSGAFASPLLRPTAQWWTFYELLVIGFCAAAAALSSRAATDFHFYLCQGLVIDAALVSVLLLGVVKPHVLEERWRAAVSRALYLVTAVAAALAIALRSSEDFSGPQAWALGLVPGVLAVGVYATLVSRWWRSLVEGKSAPAAAEAASPPLPAGAAGAEGATPARSVQGRRGERFAISQLKLPRQLPPPAISPLSVGGSEDLPPHAPAAGEAEEGSPHLVASPVSPVIESGAAGAPAFTSESGSRVSPASDATAAEQSPSAAAQLTAGAASSRSSEAALGASSPPTAAARAAADALLTWHHNPLCKKPFALKSARPLSGAATRLKGEGVFKV
jgi:hypothetical protein